MTFRPFFYHGFRLPARTSARVPPGMCFCDFQVLIIQACCKSRVNILGPNNKKNSGAQLYFSFSLGYVENPRLYYRIKFS